MAEYVFKSKLLVSSCLKLEKPLVKGSAITINQQPASSNQQPKLIMDFVDVDSDKWTQYSKYAGFPKSWIYALEGRRLADYERGIAEAFDHLIFVTQAEVEVFKKLNPHIQGVIAISNGVDLDYFSPTFSQEQATRNQSPATNHHEPSTINQQLESSNEQPVLVFTGAMDYYANIDGVVWFTKEVLPLIKKEIPDVQFFIVGSNPTKEVIELSGKNGVTVTGYVPDTREYLRRATVAVVPLRIARGIQNKILEAMAMGLPVVATPQAFEGIEAKPDRDLILGENVEKIAEGVLKLMREAPLRKSLGDSARIVIENNYCWTKNLEKLNNILTK
jgi:sugar transferase (PEP-CTERM/EpsH1 system associated)